MTTRYNAHDALLPGQAVWSDLGVAEFALALCGFTKLSSLDGRIFWTDADGLTDAEIIYHPRHSRYFIKITR